jgi:hypothetical protein
VKIFNFAGKLYKEINLDAGNFAVIPINLSSGMYMVQVEVGTAIKHIRKLLVVK